MSSDPLVEHYVTLFDSNFVLCGLALHDSLARLSDRFHLWIVAADSLAQEQLRRLALPNVTVVPLEEMETDQLLAVKSGRTRGEYCWTLTPFLPSLVFTRDSGVGRVTYLDADLFFFSSPRRIFREFERSGKSVMITDHAYAPEYDRSATSGRFCVQFMIFNRGPEAMEVLSWWQQRCIEWCFARYEDGRFGDQKYVERWPELFPGSVHVFNEVSKSLAPWNLEHFGAARDEPPVFVHFQSFRILSDRRIKLYQGYRIGPPNLWVYAEYLKSTLRQARRIMEIGYRLPSMPEHFGMSRNLRYAYLRLRGEIRFFDPEPYLSGRTLIDELQLG